jgi:hypothetical protein
MAFGLSFGSKKQKTNQTSTVDKAESTNQQQSGTTSSSSTANSLTTGQSSGSTVGQQTTSQTGTNKTTGTQTGQSTQTTSAFSASTLGAIEKAVGDLFGKVGGTTPISAFDKEAFISNTVGKAASDIGAGLESNVNQLITNLGGTAGTNSMGALLTNRLRNDAAAEVAGVRATTTAQAEEIARSNALAGSQIAGQDQGFLGQLLGALKGGVTTTTGTESTQTAQDQQTQNTGTSNTAERTSQQQSQQSTQTQQLIEMMSQLLSGTTNTKGTENVKGTGKSGGGGFSIGL